MTCEVTAMRSYSWKPLKVKWRFKSVNQAPSLTPLVYTSDIKVGKCFKLINTHALSTFTYVRTQILP